LWKYSCATTDSTPSKSASVAISGRGEHVLRVEDVQALVLHRAHVEVGHGDDHEAVEVELEPEALFVPADGAHQRLHRVTGLVFVAGFDPHLQQHAPARHRGQVFFAGDQPAGHHGEQVAGLGERIFPDGLMARAAIGARRAGAVADQVAVGQQHRAGFGVGAQRDAVARHHVGPVGEPGDASESFGFALREVVAVGHVQTHQRRVLRRLQQRDDLEHEALGRGVDLEPVAPDAVFAVGERTAIDRDRDQFEAVAVEHARAAAAVAPAHAAEGAHAGAVGVEIELEFDVVHQKFRRGIVAPLDGLGLIVAHGSPECRTAILSACRRPARARVPSGRC
jgi:hypothetical protein